MLHGPTDTVPNAVLSVRRCLQIVSFGFGFVAVGGSTGPPRAAAAMAGVNRAQALGKVAAALVDVVLVPTEAPAALALTPIRATAASVVV